MRAAALLALLLVPAAAAAPLAEEPGVRIGWRVAALADGDNATLTDAEQATRLDALAGTHEFPLVVVSAVGPLRNATLLLEAQGQPFALSFEGPEPADARPNATKPYAFWPTLPLADGSCACGFVLVHSKHSDDFSGGFEWTARLFFERADGTRAWTEDTLRGHIAGGVLRAQPWQVWLVGATLVVVIGAAIWTSRRRHA